MKRLAIAWQYEGYIIFHHEYVIWDYVVYENFMLGPIVKASMSKVNFVQKSASISQTYCSFCRSNCRAFLAFFNPCRLLLEYFDDELLDSIVYQTNLYVKQKQRKVSPVTKLEMKGFMGINLITGYHKLPSWYHYWSIEPDLSVSLVASTMPVTDFSRFFQIYI